MDQLNISGLEAIIGASYGGLVGLSFREIFPDKLKKLIVISAGHRSHPMARGWRHIQRQIMDLVGDLDDDRKRRGIALARALAMTSYRTPDEFEVRFRHDDVIDYLEARGRDYSEKVNAECYYTLSESIDLHNIDPSPNEVKTHIIGFWEDRLVPSSILKELAEKTQGSLHIHSSLFGHDAFLKEIDLLWELLPRFLGGRI